MDGVDAEVLGAGTVGPETGALPVARLAALRPLLAEIGALKRVHRDGASVAAHAFADGWAALAAGRTPAEIAARDACRAAAATVLGPLDATALARAGLPREGIVEVVREALGMQAERLGPHLLLRLDEAVGLAAAAEDEGSAPEFVARLAATPRAGPTCPGKPRIPLEPAESHAEHCWTVAVHGALIALAEPSADGVPPCDVGRIYLTGMAHHLHNAWLPDGGFAGETALGRHLAPLMADATARALGQLDAPLRAATAEALAGKDRTDTPEGAAFNAADALDRVLEMAHFERVARFRLADALDDLEIVHPGPLQAFQLAALRAAGVAP